jgi:hypothetical protein
MGVADLNTRSNPFCANSTYISHALTSFTPEMILMYSIKRFKGWQGFTKAFWQKEFAFTKKFLVFLNFL